MKSIKKKGKRLKGDNHAKKSNSSLKKIIIQIFLIFITFLLIMFATQYIFKEIEVKETIKQQEIEAKEKEENVKKLTQSRKYKTLSIENINIYEKYGNTYFIAEIENKAESKFKSKDIVIDFVDEEQKSIIKFGYHIDEMKSGEKVEMKIITNYDLTKTYDFKIEE